MSKEQLETLLNQGISFYNSHNYKEAVKTFEEAVKLDEKCSSCWSNLGACLAKFKQYQKAIECYKKAIKLNPSFAGTYTNLGNALNKLAEHEQAVYFHLKAIHLDPSSANHYANLATAYKALGRFDRAKKMYLKALEIDPLHVNAHFDLSTVLLQTGFFAQGLHEYEWRFKKVEMFSHIKKYENIFSKTLYINQELKDKTILVHAEQGFGDSLMMARYLFHLKEKGAKITLYLREGLEEIFSDMDCVDQVQIRGEELLPFDYHLPLMSLAQRCDENLKEINKYYPYLKVREGKILGPREKKLRIGIVWGASKSGESYQNKVFNLENFAFMFNHKDIELFSLQLGEDKEVLKQEPFKSSITDLSQEINSFSDSAKIVNELDLIISSDTSLAHLSGGLGAKTWVLLQKVPDWRWAISSEKSLWYPSARLFRQDSLGDWPSVFRHLKKALEDEYSLEF